MTLKGRITQLERRRGNGWADCPDPCHRPAAPFEVQTVDYRAMLRPFVPPEMQDGLPPEPTCPRCGEPPSGVVVIARPWDATWSHSEDPEGALT